MDNQRIKQLYESSGFDARTALDNEMVPEEIEHYFSRENYEYMYGRDVSDGMTDEDFAELYLYASREMTRIDYLDDDEVSR